MSRARRGQHVVASYATTKARALQQRRVDPMLGGELAHRRRQAHALGAPGRECSRHDHPLPRLAAHWSYWNLGRGNVLFGLIAWSGASRACLDLRDDGAHPNRLAFSDDDLDQLAREWGRDLGVDFIRHDLDQRLVALD